MNRLKSNYSTSPLRSHDNTSLYCKSSVSTSVIPSLPPKTSKLKGCGDATTDSSCIVAVPLANTSYTFQRRKVITQQLNHQHVPFDCRQETSKVKSKLLFVTHIICPYLPSSSSPVISRFIPFRDINRRKHSRLQQTKRANSLP